MSLRSVAVILSWMDQDGFIGQDKSKGKGSTPDRVYQLLGFVTLVRLSVRSTTQTCRA